MNELKRLIKRSESKPKRMMAIIFETSQKTYNRLTEATKLTGLTKRAILEAALKDALDKILK